MQATTTTPTPSVCCLFSSLSLLPAAVTAATAAAAGSSMRCLLPRVRPRWAAWWSCCPTSSATHADEWRRSRHRWGGGRVQRGREGGGQGGGGGLGGESSPHRSPFRRCSWWLWQDCWDAEWSSTRHPVATAAPTLPI